MQDFEDSPTPTPRGKWAEFAAYVLVGAALGGAALWLILPKGASTPAAPTPMAAVVVPPIAARAPSVPLVTARPGKGPAPDFRGERASDDVMHLARWAQHSGDHGKQSFAILDKKDARVYVFDPAGKLLGAGPALLGSAIGDDTVPGIGNKPLAQVLPEERTTPAGRFVAEMGINMQHEDVVWVDYEAAVSMHRVRALVPSQRRLERLASPTADDNRISWGCINLPVAFYEKVLRPAVKSTGAVIYVLPETRSAQAVFGSYDVPSAQDVASLR